MLKRRSLLPLAVAGLVLSTTACPGREADTAEGEGEGEDEGEGVDIDRDGHAAPADCDDFNNTVHPGARERSFDGIDSNCDGEELPALGEDRFAEALGVIDTDEDGAISLAEFDAACASGALLGEGRPGVVSTQAACGGTSACRGMVLHPWNELFVHDCRGVNYCAGWSCTETAEDESRDGPTAFEEGGCTMCHTGENNAFKVLVPEGQDVDAFVAGFLDRPDARFRAAIAFGISGISEGHFAYRNMPPHYEILSRAEMDTVIAFVRGKTLVGENYVLGDVDASTEPGE